MNPALAALYGFDKTASEAASGEVDLSTISAADYLEAMAAQEVAGDNEELDLANMSARELVELAESLDEAETAEGDEEALQKMAESGELKQWDLAGRIMAHAYADELSKVASEGGDELPDEISLDDISAEDLVTLLESGEYEIEKTAGVVSRFVGKAERNIARLADVSPRSAYKAGAKLVRKGKASAKAGGERYVGLMKGKKTSKAVAGLAGKKAGFGGRMKTHAQVLLGSKGTKGQISEARKSFGARAGTAAGVAGIGGGAFAFNKKK